MSDNEPVIVYTEHAKRRMSQRRISKEQVTTTVRDPVSVARLYDELDKWEFTRSFGARTVIVVAYRSRNIFKIKTVYYE